MRRREALLGLAALGVVLLLMGRLRFEKHFFPLLLVALFCWSCVFFLPNFIRGRPRGGVVPCKSNLKNLGTALEMYSTDFQGHYPPTLAQLTPSYIKTIPTCPSAGVETYSATYEVQLGDKKVPDHFTIFCKGHNHERANVPADYPQYNAIQGLIER